jgi:hypothetical protein
VLEPGAAGGVPDEPLEVLELLEPELELAPAAVLSSRYDSATTAIPPPMIRAAIPT